MLDLEKEPDEEAEGFRGDMERVTIFPDGHVESDRTKSPIEYLGSFREKHKPDNVVPVDHFYYPELHFDTYYNDLIPAEDSSHHYARDEAGNPLVHAYYDSVLPPQEYVIFSSRN